MREKCQLLAGRSERKAIQLKLHSVVVLAVGAVFLALDGRLAARDPGLLVRAGSAHALASAAGGVDEVLGGVAGDGHFC